MERMFNIKEASKVLRRTPQCLRLWDKSGKLKAKRTITNHRFYTEQQLHEYLNIKEQLPIRKNVVYCRVSSYNQKQDLKNQRKVLEEYCLKLGIENPIFIEEIGGGLNLKRKEFLSLINDITNEKVDKLIIAHKDRLARFGFPLIEHLCKENNTTIIVLNSETFSPQEEMVKDLMIVVNYFSFRLDGLKNYKKELKKLLEVK